MIRWEGKTKEYTGELEEGEQQTETGEEYE
jgi:hypothetical protein